MCVFILLFLRFVFLLSPRARSRFLLPLSVWVPLSALVTLSL